MQTSARLARNMKTVSIPPQHECNIGIRISKRNSGDIVHLSIALNISLDSQNVTRYILNNICDIGVKKKKIFQIKVNLSCCVS
jgi:xanthine dehydrogenase iron-sulfur cluster and FAD-binding subunit A